MSKEKGIKLIIAGSRDVEDYELVERIINEGILELGIKKIGCIVSGGARGVDKLGERYAQKHGITIINFIPDWEDIKTPNAVIKERYNKWKKKQEKYNANAGFARNQEMADYAEALIAINLGTNGTDDMVKKATKKGLKVYEYKPKPLQDDEFDYQF